MLAATLLYDCSDTPGGGASSRPVAAALSVRVAGAASPHGGTDTLRTAAAVPRLTRLAAMPRPARHTCPGDRVATVCLARQRTPRTAAGP